MLVSVRMMLLTECDFVRVVFVFFRERFGDGLDLAVGFFVYSIFLFYLFNVWFIYLFICLLIKM